MAVGRDAADVTFSFSLALVLVNESVEVCEESRLEEVVIKDTKANSSPAITTHNPAIAKPTCGDVITVCKEGLIVSGGFVSGTGEGAALIKGGN